MSILVVCPGCKKRFTVSEKFAGQKGPCPKCKAEITIPGKEEEVVIHAPETAGPKDSKGKSVVKPILREETRFSGRLAVIFGAAALVVLILAWLLPPHPLVLMLGAVGLGPPLVWGGYSFLRDDELEAYYGQELWARVGGCSAAYAFLWGAFWWVQWVLDIDYTVTHMVFVAPALVLAGGFAALASFDLDYLLGMVHYGLYLLVTTLLCFLMKVQLFV